MDTIEERLPPNSIEAEEAVLGSILIDPDAYYEVARILTRPTDFYSTRNRWIWEAIREKEDVACTPLDLRELMVLSVATSIDALAAGIAFAVLSTSITRPVIIIGLVTAALSMLGVMIGSRFGQTFRAKAQVAGGAVLCLIGIKILLDHLNV